MMPAASSRMGSSFTATADNMIEAFRSALFKRGKPERLYFDNGSNYTSKEILQACVRLDIRLTHRTPRPEDGE